MGALLDIQFRFPDWAGKLKRHAEALNRLVAAVAQTNRGMLFDAEGAYNGHPKWAPLRLRAGQILSQRGTLRKSIAPANPQGKPGKDGIVRFEGEAVIIGTTLLYARMMNDGTAKMPGGVLRAKNAKALKIPLPSGASANEAARGLRQASVLSRIAKESEALAKAEKSRAKARLRFIRSGRDVDLEKSVAAEMRRVNRVRRIEALRKKADAIMETGKGGANFIFRKWVRIPPRNFIDWNEQDQAEVDGALLSKVAEVLNRG